jgi:trehalose 6-phosphate phosphatase
MRSAQRPHTYHAPLANPDWALFLDVDGTLLDIASTPDAVTVPSGLIGNLERVRLGLGGALALITGRSIANVDHLFRPLRFVVAGQHGAEMRNCASAATTRVSDAVPPPQWRERIEQLAGQYPGVLIEDKGLTIAVHYRNAPAASSAIETLLNQFLEQDSRFVVQAGKFVAELRPRALTKASALVELMRMDPFRGRSPVMIGDDLTDEDAFRAAISLGGMGFRVGRGSDAEAMDFAEPSAVRHWLAASAESLTPRATAAPDLS